MPSLSAAAARPGSTTRSPSAVQRIASANCSSGASLSRKPAASDSIARRRNPGLPNVVRISDRDPRRATAVAQSVAFLLIFVGLLSSLLPAAVASLTRYLPVSYVTDGMQRLSDGGQVPAVGQDLAWLLGWAVVLLVAAGRVLRWD
jgi:hypothetical protein